MNIRVTLIDRRDLAALLALLEESLRNGEPVPEAFAELLAGAVESGDLEVLGAYAEGGPVGVAILAYRLNVAAGGLFASIEDLYVRPEVRRQGVGRALMRSVKQRCAARRVSYVEVEVEDGSAEAFYAACGYEREPDVRVMSVSHVL
ncbi:MAG TPA: GNAT family N-acetyltransferase [Rubrobacteraceae bacterium]|nr:GNAT family N-acetyltransferase [Rubrobacteraceae bacterium]